MLSFQRRQTGKRLWIAGMSPLHVFLTVCPLAQCWSQTVLPKLACVTLSLSNWSVLRAGMVFQPISEGIWKTPSCVWPCLLCVCVCEESVPICHFFGEQHINGFFHDIYIHDVCVHVSDSFLISLSEAVPVATQQICNQIGGSLSAAMPLL